jgi:hypothetical protein
VIKFLKGGRALVSAIVIAGATVSGLISIAPASAPAAYALCAPPSASVQAPFVGEWHNVDSTGLITRVDITAPDGCIDEHFRACDSDGNNCKDVTPPGPPPNQYTVNVYNKCPNGEPGCPWRNSLFNDHSRGGPAIGSAIFLDASKVVWLWYYDSLSNPGQQAYLRVDVYSHEYPYKFLDREYFSR